MNVVHPSSIVPQRDLDAKEHLSCSGGHKTLSTPDRVCVKSHVAAAISPSFFFFFNDPSQMIQVFETPRIERKHTELQSRWKIFLDQFVLAFSGEMQSD